MPLEMRHASYNTGSEDVSSYSEDEETESQDSGAPDEPARVQPPTSGHIPPEPQHRARNSHQSRPVVSVNAHHRRHPNPPHHGQQPQTHQPPRATRSYARYAPLNAYPGHNMDYGGVPPDWHLGPPGTTAAHDSSNPGRFPAGNHQSTNQNYFAQDLPAPNYTMPNYSANNNSAYMAPYNYPSGRASRYPYGYPYNPNIAFMHQQPWQQPGMYQPEPPASATRPPLASSPADPEKMRLEAELAAFRARSEERKQLEKQKEEEAVIRKDAEEALQRRMEDLRRAQEEAKVEIENVKREAENAARFRIEAERKAEEERRSQFERAQLEAERAARLKIQAEKRAEEERSRMLEAQERRLEREIRFRIETERLAEIERQKELERSREQMEALTREKLLETVETITAMCRKELLLDFERISKREPEILKDRDLSQMSSVKSEADAANRGSTSTQRPRSVMKGPDPRPVGSAVDQFRVPSSLTASLTASSESSSSNDPLPKSSDSDDSQETRLPSVPDVPSTNSIDDEPYDNEPYQEDYGPEEYTSYHRDPHNNPRYYGQSSRLPPRDLVDQVVDTLIQRLLTPTQRERHTRYHHYEEDLDEETASIDDPSSDSESARNDTSVTDDLSINSSSESVARPQIMSGETIPTAAEELASKRGLEEPSIAEYQLVKTILRDSDSGTSDSEEYSEARERWDED